MNQQTILLIALALVVALALVALAARHLGAQRPILPQPVVPPPQPASTQPPPPAAQVPVPPVQLAPAPAAPTPPATYEYDLCGSLLSKAELTYFDVLQAVIDDDLYVCPKVRLGDLIMPARGLRQGWAPGNKVQQKHVDFVLCKRATMQPLLVIELDDGSHGRSSRRQRDAFVDESLQGAGLPVVHQPFGWTYAREQVRASLREALGRSAAESTG